eukprot:Trichotokara_eunicae@DN10205_c0_g1_i1.p1
MYEDLLKNYRLASDAGTIGPERSERGRMRNLLKKLHDKEENLRQQAKRIDSSLKFSKFRSNTLLSMTPKIDESGGGSPTKLFSMFDLKKFGTFGSPGGMSTPGLGSSLQTLGEYSGFHHN